MCSRAITHFTVHLMERGFEPVSTTVLLEADLGVPEPRDPRTAVIRRQTQIEFLDDSLPTDWWQNLALGDFQLMSARLLLKADATPVARAQAWDMNWFGRDDGADANRLDQRRSARRTSSQRLRTLPGE